MMPDEIRELGTTVIVLRNGHHRGYIVGRTLAGDPKYDIKCVDKIFHNIGEDELKSVWADKPVLVLENA